MAMIKLRLGGEGKEDSSQAMLVSRDTYGLLDRHTFMLHQGASLPIGGVVAEHRRNCSDYRSTYKFSLVIKHLFVAL